jgi:hypothetical protein
LDTATTIAFVITHAARPALCLDLIVRDRFSDHEEQTKRPVFILGSLDECWGASLME